MSMNGYLKRITPNDLLQIQKDPKSIKKFLCGGYDMESAIRDQISGKSSPQRDAIETAYTRSFQLGQEMRKTATGPITPEEIKKIMQPLLDAGADGGNESILELEKSWHTLHYLLTGSGKPVNAPLGNAILGGQEIGPDLAGYGPARFLSPEQVKQVTKVLTKLSENDLAKHFDLKAMKASKVYACRSKDELPLAQEYFKLLKEFYAETASGRKAMLLYIK